MTRTYVKSFKRTHRSLEAIGKRGGYHALPANPIGRVGRWTFNGQKEDHHRLSK
jgi:hypothetical protein